MRLTKKVLKYAFMFLLVLYIFRSCCYAYTYEDFINFTEQTADEVPTNQYNQNAAAFYLLHRNSIESNISSRGFDINSFNNFIVRVSYTTSSGVRYYYYDFYFYNYGSNGSITINSSTLNIYNMVGCRFSYRVRGGYNGSYELWNSNSNFSDNLLNQGYSKTGYYGLQTLPIDNYYDWRLENDYNEPIRVSFIPNGDDVFYLNNNFTVYNLQFYYEMTYWINLGNISGADNLDIIANFARISEPILVNGVLEYHMYETFGNDNNNYFSVDDKYVDVYNYVLKSGYFYVLNLAFYNSSGEFVTNIQTFYYFNGVPSGDWLIVRSGDKLYQPDGQTNTLNIIEAINDGIGSPGSGDEPGTGIIGAINDGFNSLFIFDSGDVDDIYNNALSYFPSGDSPTVLYDLIFGSLDGNSSGDFIISWDNFNLILTVAGGNVLYSGDFIAGNSINFSKFCRENEQFSLLKGYINAFTQFFFILTFLFVFYKCIIIMLGLSSDFINEELTPGSDDYKRHEIGFIQGGRK